MTSFIVEFGKGYPVVVYRGDRMVGIPCGFVLFNDGLSWADDGILQDYCSHFPYHHLYGDIKFHDGKITCDGFTFAPAPVWDANFGNPWSSHNLEWWQWQALHKVTIRKLRVDRMKTATFD